MQPHFSHLPFLFFLLYILLFSFLFVCFVVLSATDIYGKERYAVDLYK